jgi:drug/metabolite transporter (DMT)-like permease
MAWLPLALAAPAIMTVVNFIDKYLLERHIPEHRALPIFAGLSGALASLVIIPFVQAELAVPTTTLLILLIAGMSVIVGAVFYFQAISRDQASTVILIFQVTPLLTLILGWGLLGETIGGWQLVGFFLILVAAAALSIQPNAGKFRISLTAWLMFAAAFTVAARSVLVRTIPTSPSYSSIVVYTGLGQGIGAVLLYMFSTTRRQVFHQTFATTRKSALVMLGLNETFFLVGSALGNLAITLGPVALVNVLGGTASFYGIVFGALLTMIAPTIFKESLAKTDLLRKAGLAMLLFAGLGMVVLGNAAS